MRGLISVEGNKMGLKLNRNTGPARTKRLAIANQKRLAKKREIIKVICPDFCEPQDPYSTCCDGNPPDGISLLTCRSLSFIADHLNTWDIETLQGKTGNWQPTLVANVFKEEKKRLDAIREKNSW